ncbi:MAG: Na(+)/H(+) antiporter NhaA [Microbacteriaceae bacterium]|jgi:NhaA family Na+:H+ antiporter|nr:Na(+)/H(+) antiporter NhaA [Microbacteriaceae bacterium]
MIQTLRNRFVPIFRSDRHCAVLLLVAAALGLALANSPLRDLALGLKTAHFGLAGIGLNFSVSHWIADGLLVVFFFVVAAELKNELTNGQLNSLRKALVPIIAAVCGVVGPALVYLLIAGEEAAHGWPVPTATDIAFALGVLAVFGPGLPSRLRIFLLALAVLDDLIGIILIAVLFTEDLNVPALAAAAAAIGCFGLLSRSPHRDVLAVGLLMAVVAVSAWFFVVQSGIHPTLTGVGLGLVMRGSSGRALAHHLVPWSNGVILPLFAFTAALVPLPQAQSLGPVFVGLAVALPVGKAVGITFGGLIGARFARKHGGPELSVGDLFALAVTGGLGFTVALLMNQLTFAQSPELMDQGALGVLAGSGLSLVAGAALIGWRSRVHARLGCQAVTRDRPEPAEDAS